MACQHTCCSSVKLTRTKNCYTCDYQITANYRAIVCYDCKLVNCVNCYSHKNNLLINSKDIQYFKTDGDIYCNSCLILLNTNNIKCYGEVRNGQGIHVLCDKCIQKIKQNKFSNANYNDLLLLKKDIEEKNEMCVIRQSQVKKKCEENFIQLQKILSQKQEQIDQLQQNVFYYQSLLEQYKPLVDQLVFFQKTYQPIITKLQNSQRNQVEVIAQDFIQKTFKTEDQDQLSAPSNYQIIDAKIKVLQIQWSHQHENVESQMTNQKTLFDERFEQLQNLFDKKINDLSYQQDNKIKDLSLTTYAMCQDSQNYEQSKRRKIK